MDIKYNMEKSTIYGILIFVMIVGGGLFLIKGNSANGNVIAENIPSEPIAGEIQKIMISEKDLNYHPSEIKVKANQPVELTLDGSVKGCLRSFTIKDLGVSKNAKTPADTITFTPTKKGTFTFTCSMGMGYGKIIVG